MPEKPRRVRRLVEWLGSHDSKIMGALFVIALVVAIIGWNKAAEAQRRVTTVEATLEAQRLGKNIADVTTCFNRAKGRPQLVRVLRAFANAVPDPVGRLDAHDLVDQYEQDTPSVPDCVALARKLGIDPDPYTKNPPTEAGNGEENR